jgi:hypothetical protein
MLVQLASVDTLVPPNFSTIQADGVRIKIVPPGARSLALAVPRKTASALELGVSCRKLRC